MTESNAVRVFGPASRDPKKNQVLRLWTMLRGACMCLLLLMACAPVWGQDDEGQSVAEAARAARARQAAPTSGSSTAQMKGAPVTATQIVAWGVAGMSAGDIASSVKARGTAFAADDGHVSVLKQAGVDAEILAVLASAAAHPEIASGGEIPAGLVTASQAFHSGDYQGATKALEPLAPQNASAEVYAAQGNLEFLLKDLDAAKAAYQKAVQADPSFAYAHVKLAGLCYRLEEKSQMVSEAKKALQLQPGNAEARKYVALSFAMEGHGGSGGESGASAEAAGGGALEDVDDLREAAHNINQEAKDWNNKGNEYSSSGNYSNAEEAYRKAIQIEPNAAVLHYNLGGMYGHWPGHTDQAIAEYREAVKLAPRNMAVRQNLGHTLCESGHWNEAIDVFQQMLHMDPEWNMARPCLINSLNHLGRTAEAQQVAKDYQKYGGDDAE
jgi:pentatricopeptide repeat protein